jgi:hypothetical protein
LKSWLRTCTGAPVRSNSRPHGLEIPDQLALLAVDRDRRLTRRDRLRDRPVDLLELRVAVGIGGALAGLSVGRQAVSLGLQQPQHRAIDDVVAHPAQRLGELGGALGRPPQRRLRIATRHRIDQRLQILPKPRLTLKDRHAPGPRATHPPRLKHLPRIEIRKPPQHRRLRDPRRPYHRRDPTPPRRPRLRPQPPTPLIQHALLAQQPIPLSDRALINHRHPVLHNTNNSFTN